MKWFCLDVSPDLNCCMIPFCKMPENYHTLHSSIFILLQKQPQVDKEFMHIWLKHHVYFNQNFIPFDGYNKTTYSCVILRKKRDPKHLKCNEITSQVFPFWGEKCKTSIILNDSNFSGRLIMRLFEEYIKGEKQEGGLNWKYGAPCSKTSTEENIVFRKEK